MNSWTITMTSYKALCTVQEGEVWDQASLPPLQGLPANISRLCADLKATTVLNRPLVSLPCQGLQIVWSADNRGLGGGSLAKRPLYCRQMRCGQEPTTGGAKFVLYGSFRQVFMDQEECANLKAKEAHLANVFSVTGVM